ncbi:MAG: type II secretion system protein [bacterium]|nr:type II secretion system protein [bacterium]
MKRYGFTLAEVLITLAIIGVVAAISIPSVISNSQQQEFKTGLRKAVSVLNSAITMNMALDGETPYDNADLFRYLQRHMSVMNSMTQLPWQASYKGPGGNYDSGFNSAFYTTDGIRFEFDDWGYASQRRTNLKLHESDVTACFAQAYGGKDALYENGVVTENCGGCGSLGLSHNPNNTTKPPCAILVDVNGDRKPTPQKAATDRSTCLKDPDCSKVQYYVFPEPDEKRLTDIFVVLITEDRAVPYGVIAQKAMYQAQKQ